jgi:HAD superfamily hydrolase (TIGR01490 family)
MRARMALSTRQVGAFFDVDNTVVPGPAIEVRFFRYLWERGRVGVPEAARSLLHLLRHIPPLSLQPLRQRKLYLEGKQPSTLEPVAEEFVERSVCPGISSQARRALDRHRLAGHHVVLVTASLDFLIAPLARHLKIGTVVAAIPERRADRYTGQVLPPLPYGGGKRHLIERLAAQHGLDLRYSYAYGDSPGDVQTLQTVGYPVVVNPIRGMKQIAAREGWPVETWE